MSILTIICREKEGRGRKREEGSGRKKGARLKALFKLQ